MRTKIKFSTDEESKTFHATLGQLFVYLKGDNQESYVNAMSQVIEDNINLFNENQKLTKKVQELEHERTTKSSSSKSI